MGEAFLKKNKKNKKKKIFKKMKGRSFFMTWGGLKEAERKSRFYCFLHGVQNLGNQIVLKRNNKIMIDHNRDMKL